MASAPRVSESPAALRSLTAGALFLAALCGYAQEMEASPDFRKIFNEAERHISWGNYNKALPLYLKLYESDPANANLSFKIGVCYFNSYSFDFPKDQILAIGYFRKALEGASELYKVGSHKERKAPLDTYFYLAETFHFLHQIDSAEHYYGRFRSLIAASAPDVIPDVDRRLVMCANARDLMENPLNVFITNLGDRINSGYNDYAPVISADESTLIFTSTREGSTGGYLTEDGQYYEDLYISTREESGAWSSPVSIGENINTGDHEATISLSADGKTLFIYKAEGEEGSIFVSLLSDTGWTVPAKLGENINSEGYESHASLSADGKTLYFTSERKGGYGGLDIYRSGKQADGTWGPAVNLGPTFNTPYDEDSPFIHPDGKTLYFSSDGHKTMGGYDIFRSTLGDDGSWSEPENLGYPINSAADNIFFVINQRGNHAYYASVRENGYGGLDLYRLVFQEGEEEEDEEVAEDTPDEAGTDDDVKDTVSAVTLEDEKEGDKVREGEEVREGDEVKEEKADEGKEVKEVETGRKETADAPPPTKFKPLYFGFDKVVLSAESVTQLKLLRDYLLMYTSVRVELTGHTDALGPDSYNMSLSKNRTVAVFDYLRSKGIDDKRIIVLYKGETIPATTNDTREGRQLNRRVEIRLIN